MTTLGEGVDAPAGGPVHVHPPTIPGVVHDAADRFGGALAVRDGVVSLSFEELSRFVTVAARGFRSLGVGRGDFVGLWAPNRWEWIVAAAGAQEAGAAIVPISTRSRGVEAAEVLARTGATVLVVVGEFLGADFPEMLAAHRASLPELRTLVVLGPHRGTVRGALTWEEMIGRGLREPATGPEDSAADPDGIADVIFTSGTTGRPKGVLLRHRQTVEAYAGFARVLGLGARDRYLVVNPFSHSFGYKAGWVTALMCGTAVYPMARFDVRATLELVARERITVLPGTPTLYHSLLRVPPDRRGDLSSLRVALTGGADIPAGLVDRMRRELGFLHVHTAYGLTEASALVTMTRAEDPPDTVAETVGRPLPGVEVQIHGEDGRPVVVGHTGEIRVRGANVMRGYHADPASTREAVDTEGWLHTGDLGHLRADGNLVITGRLKDMFISGGFNCYPAEIENLLLAHPNIAQVAVAGLPDERMGEVCAAWVVPAPGAVLDPDELRGWAVGTMSSYKVPRYWHVVSELPTTENGKVQRAELPRRASISMERRARRLPGER